MLRCCTTNFVPYPRIDHPPLQKRCSLDMLRYALSLHGVLSLQYGSCV